MVSMKSFTFILNEILLTDEFFLAASDYRKHGIAAGY